MTLPSSLGRLVIGLLVCAFLGCGGGGERRTTDEDHLMQLTQFYSRYLGKNKGQTPGSVEELKTFMKQQGLDDDKIAGLLVSPRDQQPYRITVKAKIGPPSSEGPILIHEQTGKDGKRMVAIGTGQVVTWDDEKFQAALKKK